MRLQALGKIGNGRWMYALAFCAIKGDHYTKERWLVDVLENGVPTRRATLILVRDQISILKNVQNAGFNS